MKTKPASSLSWLRYLAALLAVALAFTLAPAPARADDVPTSIDRDALADLLFAAQIQTRDAGVDTVGQLVLSAELLEWRHTHPAATPPDVTAHLTARRQALTTALSAQDLALPEPEFAVRAMTVLMTTPPSSIAGATHVTRLLDAAVGGSVADYDTREDLASGALHTAHWLRNKDGVETDLWGEVRRTALTDPAFAEAWNTVIGAPVGVDATASLETMKQDDHLTGHLNVDALLAREGSSDDLLTEAKRQYEQAGVKLATQSAEARERLRDQTDACPADKDTKCTKEQQDAAKKAAEEAKKTIDRLGTAAKVLGRIAGLYDPEAGKTLTKAATAWVAAIEAVDKYMTAVAGRGAKDALFSMATLTLTGNLFGVATTLIGLFSGGGGGGPSADELILRQVKELRRELDALGQQMQEGFEHIDTKLNLIYESMMVEFAKIEAALEGQAADLARIQNNLAVLSLRLEEVAASILTAIGDVELKDARAAVNRYIGYEETYGEPIPTYGEYITPENELHYAATQTARHTSFVVPATTGGDPAVVLDTRGEAASLSYLAGIAASREPAIPFPGADVPNPSVWNFAAQAYMLLQLQNPGYAAQVSSARSRDIATQGRRIVDTARSFSQPAVTPDASGSRTNRLFTSLLTDYRKAVASLSTALTWVRTNKVQVRKEGTTVVRNKPYNLFGSSTQSVPVVPDPSKLAPCSPAGATADLSRPSNVSYGKLPAALRFAVHAFEPELQGGNVPQQLHCYSAAWTSTRTVDLDEYGTATYGRLQLTISTRFRWNDTASWRTSRKVVYTWPEQLTRRVCQGKHCGATFSTTPTQALFAKWPTSKATFERDASASVDSVLTSEVSKRMREFLVGRQHAYYVFVQDGLWDTTSPVFSPVQKLNTAARLLHAFTRLGFPVALATDDLLSGLLFGQHQLPANLGSDLVLDTTFGVAGATYSCYDPADAPGAPCAGGSYYNPLRNQPNLDTYVDWWTYDAVCNVGGATGLPGDPVGNCVVANAIARADALAARYGHHSQRLADGVYVETLPWVERTVEALPIVDAAVRAA